MGWVRSDGVIMRPEHAALGEGDRPSARRQQGRARQRGPERDPRRHDGPGRQARPRPRLLGAQRPRLRLPHPRRADRLLQLPDLQLGLHDHQVADRASTSRASWTRSSTRSRCASSPRRSAGRTQTSGPASSAGARSSIEHLTKNRSLEAHLYDHGIHLPYGKGKVSEDPKGRLHTIDPEANVLRVDKIIGGRDVPVGMWSTFANHGTVNHYQFTYYNEDHHGAATHLVERAIRRKGDVPKGQDVVDAYGNTDEGDQSSGPRQVGSGRRPTTSAPSRRASSWPPGARPGATWTAPPPSRAAGPGCASAASRRRPGRWPTRACSARRSSPAPRRAAGRCTTRRASRSRATTCRSAPARRATRSRRRSRSNVPRAVPLMALQVGDRMVVSVPGEMTEEMGRRVRHAVEQAAAGHGVVRAVISGLANEYADYFTTPEEYDAQHYEGAATVYGRASSVALQETLVQLTPRLGQRAQGAEALRVRPAQRHQGEVAALPEGRRARQDRQAAAADHPPPPASHGRLAGRPPRAGPAARAGLRARPAPLRRALANGGLGPRPRRPLAGGLARPLPRRVGGAVQPSPGHLPLPDHGQSLRPDLAAVPAEAVNRHDRSTGACPRGPGRGPAPLPQAGRPRGRRRAAA